MTSVNNHQGHDTLNSYQQIINNNPTRKTDNKSSITKQQDPLAIKQNQKR